MRHDKHTVNKKLLLINYYWPPSGGPAVQRWLSLTSELSKLGWKIWVLTVDEKYATYQMYDESLLNEIDQQIQVVKTKTIEPFGFYKLLFGKKSIPAPGFSNEANPSFLKKVSRFIRGNFFTPDPRKYWKRFAVKEAQKIITLEKISCIITAGPPHSTHFIGKALKEKNTINWICDFHDLWTDVIYYDLLYHLTIIKNIDRRLEKLILESCDFILTVGEKYKQKLLSKSSNIRSEKIALTRIGYDDKMFGQNTVATGEQFVISYVGSIAAYYQPEVFFEAIKEVVNNTSCNIQIQFIGVTSPVIRELIYKYNLQNNYNEVGYVNHEKAVQYMLSSSVLLLINPVTKDESMVIPGKIYEYLATGKPIINITKKDSETAALIEASNAGKTFERNERKLLQDYILDLYLLWEKDRLTSFNPNWQVIKKFSCENIAKELDAHLTQL